MFKLLFLLPLVASLIGTVLAAPIAADVSFAARQFRHNKGAAPAGAFPPGAGAPPGATGAGFPPGAGALPGAGASPGTAGAGAPPGAASAGASPGAAGAGAPPGAAGAGVPAGAGPPSGVPAGAPSGATGAGAPAGAAAPMSAGAPATAAATNGTPCTNTDQSVASFGGPSPDEGLPQCSSVAVPFECTNSQTIADAFKVPFCNGAPTA